MRTLSLPAILEFFGHLIGWWLVWQVLSSISLVEIEVVEEIGDQEFVSTVVNHPYFQHVRIVGGMLVFYAHAWLLFPKLFIQRRRAFYLIAFLLTVFMAGAFQSILDRQIINTLTATTDAALRYRSEPIGINMTGLIMLNMIILSLSYSFISNWAKDQRVKEKILAEKMQAENELLRAQINPHFLFNTLNTFYSIAQKQGVKDIEEGIATLSEMFRYTLDANQMQAVPLEKEIEYIEAYIYLQKLRFNEGDNIDLSFEIEGSSKGHKIHQMILINLVENAFKHGIRANGKSMINIKLRIEHQLFFEIVNSRASNESDNSTRLGMKNLKKRLNILYPEAHELQVSKSSDRYTCQLNLALIHE